MKFAVIREVTARGQKHRQVRLVVEDAPEKTTTDAVMDALSQAGRTGTTSPPGKVGEFQEAGIAWGGHSVKSVTQLPAGTEGLDAAPVESWTDIAGSAETIRRVTLRLPAATYDRVSSAAARRNRKLQGWFEDAIESALQAQEAPTPERKAAPRKRATPRKAATQEQETAS